jgi:hypothetical protein
MLLQNLKDKEFPANYDTTHKRQAVLPQEKERGRKGKKALKKSKKKLVLRDLKDKEFHYQIRYKFTNTKKIT